MKAFKTGKATKVNAITANTNIGCAPHIQATVADIRQHTHGRRRVGCLTIIDMRSHFQGRFYMANGMYNTIEYVLNRIKKKWRAII